MGQTTNLGETWYNPASGVPLFFISDTGGIGIGRTTLFDSTGAPLFSTPYNILTGQPSVTVSPIGLANGTRYKNNGAMFGPDTNSQTSGINEGMSSLPSGGTVELLDGTFNCTAKVIVPYSHLRLRGAGRKASVISVTGSTDNGFTIVNGVTDVRVEDLAITQTFSPSGAYIGFILGQSQSFIHFENVYMNVVGGEVMFATQSGQLTSISSSNVNTNLTFKSCVFDGNGLTFGSPNIVTSMGTNVNWDGCDFVNVGVGGLVFYGLARQDVDGPHTAVGCFFSGPGSLLIVEQVYGAVITGNTFMGSGQTSFGVQLALNQNTDYSAEAGPTINTTITGNYFELTGTGGSNGLAIGVLSPGVGTDVAYNLTVSGNVLICLGTFSGGDQPTAYNFSGGTYNATFTGNTSVGFYKHCNFAHADIEQVTFSGNVFETGTFPGYSINIPNGNQVGPIVFENNVDNTTNKVYHPSGFAGFYISNLYGWTPQGWATSTPSVPAGTGSTNTVQNTFPFKVRIYQTGESGTHIIDPSGTDHVLPADPPEFWLDVLAKVYYASTVPSSWRWYGA